MIKILIEIKNFESRITITLCQNQEIEKNLRGTRSIVGIITISVLLDEGQYMAFGLSANPERSLMVGGDVVVAWVDKQTLQGYAIDYFLDAKSQCSGGRGSCPDTRIQVFIHFPIILSPPGKTNPRAVSLH